VDALRPANVEHSFARNFRPRSKDEKLKEMFTSVVSVFHNLLEFLGFGWVTIREWPPQFDEQTTILEQKNKYTGRLRHIESWI